jgi:HAD superfamily phosphatase (TIGR01668 family)
LFLEVLCPDQMAASVLDINLGHLRAKGIRGLIVDLDNTLLGWDAVDIAPQTREWVMRTRRDGFRLCIASNGLNARVRTIANDLGVLAIAKASKPRKRPFRRALQLLGVTAAQAAVVGDQLFTDVLGGNRLGLYTILITPISRKELHTTRLVRCVERRVLCRLQRRGLVHEAALRIRQEALRGKREAAEECFGAAVADATRDGNEGRRRARPT